MGARFWRWVLGWLSLAAVGVLVVAGYPYVVSLRGGGLEAEETDIEVPDCVAGQKRVVVLRLQNNAGHPMRILGTGGC